ncbi:unnamed protein product, partial [Dovyalis caffra]
MWWSFGDKFHPKREENMVVFWEEKMVGFGGWKFRPKMEEKLYKNGGKNGGFMVEEGWSLARSFQPKNGEKDLGFVEEVGWFFAYFYRGGAGIFGMEEKSGVFGYNEGRGSLSTMEVVVFGLKKERKFRLKQRGMFDWYEGGGDMVKWRERTSVFVWRIRFGQVERVSVEKMERVVANFLKDDVWSIQSLACEEVGTISLTLLLWKKSTEYASRKRKVVCPENILGGDALELEYH